MKSLLHRITTLQVMSLLLVLVLSATTAVSQKEPDIIDPAHYMPSALLPGDVLNITLAAETPPGNLTVVLDSYNATIELPSNVSEADTGLYIVTTTLPPDTAPGTYDLILVDSEGNVVAREPNSVAVFDKWPSPLRIVQFTDIHVGLIHGNRPATSFLAAGLVFAQIAGAHLTIATGDNVDVGAMTAQYKGLLETAQAFPLPKFFVPGNHERSGDPTLSNWYKFMGASNFYSKRWGPFLFVGLDSSVNGYVPQNQLEWLENVLRENNDAPVKILFTHYPVFRAKLTGEYEIDPNNISNYLNLFYSTWANNPETTARFLGIVDKYNVTLVLAGHVHADGYVVFNGKTLFVTTTSTGGGVREGDYRGAKLIEVFPNGTARIVPTPGASPFDDDTAVNLQRLDARLIRGVESVSLVVEADEFKDAQHAFCCIVGIRFRVPPEMLGENTTVVALSPGYKLPASLEKGMQYAVAWAEVPVDPNMNFTIVATSRNDTQPPSIEVYSIRPKTPRMDRDPVEITFKATDDAWGVKSITVTLKTGDEETTLPVIDVGRGFYKARIPPQGVEQASVKITAVDVSGKKAETDWITITYKPAPQPTATTPTETTQPTTTTQPMYGGETPTTTQPTTPEPTETPQATTPTETHSPTPTPTTSPSPTTTPTPTPTPQTTTTPTTPTPSPTKTPTETQSPQETEREALRETPSPTPTPPEGGKGIDTGVILILIGIVIAGAAVAITVKKR